MIHLIQNQLLTKLDPRRWGSLAIVLSATFMVILDSFIVNVAAPSIQQDLEATSIQLQFILAGYVLSYAVFLISGGRFGDLFGRKKMFIAGMGGFVAASALCGFAPTAEMLVLARILQGLAAAIMVPQVLSTIQASFPAEERPKALGWYGAISGIAVVAGQIAGGLLLHADLFGLGWRTVFLINLPIGLIAMALSLPFVRESMVEGSKKLDLAGLLLSAAGLTAMTFPLVMGREAGWPLWVFFCLAASLLFLFGFVRYEGRLMKRNGFPLMPATLFAEKSFRFGVLSILAYQGGNAALFLTLSLFLQEGLSFSPMTSALSFLSIGVGFFLGSMLAPRGVKRWGFRLLPAGAAVMALSCGYLFYTIHHFGESLQWTHFIPSLFLAGIGQGIVGAPLFTAILSRVGPNQIGAASGILSTMMQTANVLGVAVIGTLYFAVLESSGGAYLAAMYAALACILGAALLTFIQLLLLSKAKEPAPTPSN
ncbi:MFS transporter [Paenibacillus sp. A14]|uniref:MFS transporter n=1 Tax=Paenibacillus sp. A14 TaxID=3119820 RepID=UPI002FE137ED